VGLGKRVGLGIAGLLVVVLAVVILFDWSTIRSAATSLSTASSGLPVSASASAVVAADRRWLDGPATTDDPEWTAVEQRFPVGRVISFNGRIVDDVDWSATGALVIYVQSTAPSGTVPVVLNQHTTMTWPNAWGPTVPDPSADIPAVLMPRGAPDSLAGHDVSVRARQMGVPGGVVRLFALEALVRE